MSSPLVHGPGDAKEREAMSLQGKRVAILAENNYEDQELWYPYYRLKEAGADKALKRSSVQAFKRSSVQAETAPTLQRSDAPTLQRSNAPTLQRSNAPTLRRSNAPTLQRPNAPTAVVVDGNLVTSRTPADLPVFLPAIIAGLER